HFHQLAQLGFGIFRVQQGTLSAMSSTLELLLDAGVEIDDTPAGGQTIAVLRQQDGASAGGHDDTGQACQRVDDLALSLPEPGFAFLFEDVGDIYASAVLDLSIAVVEVQSQESRELAANRCLSRAHGADQENVGSARGLAHELHAL